MDKKHKHTIMLTVTYLETLVFSSLSYARKILESIVAHLHLHDRRPEAGVRNIGSISSTSTGHVAVVPAYQAKLTWQDIMYKYTQVILQKPKQGESRLLNGAPASPWSRVVMI